MLRRALSTLLIALLAGCATQGTSRRAPADARAAALAGVWVNAEPFAGSAPGQMEVEIRPSNPGDNPPIGLVELRLGGDLRLAAADAGPYRFDYQILDGRLVMFVAGRLRTAEFEVRGDELLLSELSVDEQTGAQIRKSPLRLRRAGEPRQAGAPVWRGDRRVLVADAAVAGSLRD